MFYLYNIMRGMRKRSHNHESLSLLKFMIIQQGLDFMPSSGRVKKPFYTLFLSVQFIGCHIVCIHFLTFYMGFIRVLVELKFTSPQILVVSQLQLDHFLYFSKLFSTFKPSQDKFTYQKINQFSRLFAIIVVSLPVCFSNTRQLVTSYIS